MTLSLDRGTLSGATNPHLVTGAWPSAAELLFSAVDIAGGLVSENWIILVNEDRPRQAFDLDGRAATVHEVVLQAQRTT